MEKIKLGKTDLKVSRIGLGTLAYGHKFKGIQDKEQIYDCLNFALDSGINLLDTAEEYAGGLTEKYIGDVLKDRGDREDTVIVTKVSHIHLNYKDIIKSANHSLKMLQTDYIDVYLVHWPFCYYPLSETMKAMDQLLAEGKIRYVGLSNFHNALVQEAMDNLQNGEIVVNEVEYNLIQRNVEKEIIPFLKQKGIVALTYYPLQSGFLTTNYDENSTFPENDFRNQWELFRHKENFERSRELFTVMREIAENHDATPAEVAINWQLKDEHVIPIPGAKKRSHIESNIHATQWRLTRNEISQLNAVTDNLEINWDWFDRIRPKE
ncbi:MAG: aldo/keto reductase [Candidatus Heimdallarchaeota archaeon]|nr:aldo/keto reductase [Candidatus Heimdallarchaeota archaeon]MBY8995856.1 aldo/keto reductase [Candidatus Heimdallarchaeota archaeon]